MILFRFEKLPSNPLLETTLIVISRVPKLKIDFQFGPTAPTRAHERSDGSSFTVSTTGSRLCAQLSNEGGSFFRRTPIALTAYRFPLRKAPNSWYITNKPLRIDAMYIFKSMKKRERPLIHGTRLSTIPIELLRLSVCFLFAVDPLPLSRKSSGNPWNLIGGSVSLAPRLRVSLVGSRSIPPRRPRKSR